MRQSARRFLRVSGLFAVAALLAISSPRALAGQAQGGGPEGGVARGASLGWLFVSDDLNGIMTASLHRARLRPGRPGLDLSLTTFPTAILRGALVGVPDVGLGYGVVVPGGVLLPRAGVSALLGVSGDGFFGRSAGLYWGAGLLVRTGERRGVRLDVVRHWYAADGLPPLAVSFGLTGLPPRP